MSSFEALRLIDFDHLEFAVADLDRVAETYLRMGFEQVATRELRERKLRSYLMVQNQIHILLSQSTLSSDPVAQYVSHHGDGICNVAIRCEDAVSALEIAANRGAEVADPPRAYKKDAGSVEQASIKAFGDVRHTFISRKGTLFAEGFELGIKPRAGGFGLQRIDHITNNVEMGQLEKWCSFYETVFGFQNTREFEIHTERSGLFSKVMQSPNGVLKFPINEPSESVSQIQEFIDVHHGPGIQHAALSTVDLLDALPKIRQEGIRFLETPPSYYETLKARVPNVTEPVEALQNHGVQVDGSSEGYLLQIFTENLVGPFFFEIIQRNGDEGFGEGNFRALFEALERDQIRRGVIKSPA